MAETGPIDLYLPWDIHDDVIVVTMAMAQATQIMDLQNGSNSLVLQSRDDVIEPTSPPLSSPNSGGSHGEPADFLISPRLVPVLVEPTFPGLLMIPTEGIPSADHTPPPSSPPLAGEDLISQVRTQLEYYFSKDNLSTDKYLQSQMDGDHFVPISILANFNQVKRLTSDIEVIIEAIKDSSRLQLHHCNNKVRAIPEKRCILILREIPKETPKEDIELLFSGENCPKFISCDFAENDCWYVAFDNEDEAQEAYRYLREEVREFLGKPIRARIKNTTVQRAASVPKPRPQYPPYSPVYNGQPLPFFQQPVGWTPYFDPRYTTAQIVNGFPPQTGYGGLPNTRFPIAPTVSSAVMMGGRDVGAGGRENTRESGIRRGSTGSSGGKGRHSLNNEGERRGSSSGSGHFSGGGGKEGRPHRQNEGRNLPNRLKNKQRSEEVSSGGTERREERGTDKGTGDKEKLRQRPQHRSQPKVDLAPTSTNFPPLPAVADPSSSQLPLSTTVHEEGGKKLADIVKSGRNNNGMEKLVQPVNPLIPVSTEAVTLPPRSKTPPPSIPISTPSTISSATPTITMATAISSNSQISKPLPPKPEVKVNSSKERPTVTTATSTKVPRPQDKDGSSKHMSRGSQGSRSQGNNNNSAGGTRTRHRDYRGDNRKSGSVSSRPSSQRHSPKTSGTGAAPPPPPITSSNEVEEKPIKLEEVPKQEKLSYAQMAGQKKAKPSPQKSSNGAKQLPAPASNSPPSSPVGGNGNQISSELPPLPSSPPLVPDPLIPSPLLPPSSQN